MSHELAEQLKKIKSNAKDLEVSDIRELLRPHIVGMSNIGYELPIGSFLYRARKCTKEFNIDSDIHLHQLSYPPAKLVQRGRANDIGKPVFYCSSTKQPIFFELPDLQADNHIVVSIWQTTKKLWFNNIGFTEFVFRSLGANRACPTWTGQLESSTSATSTFELSKISSTDLQNLQVMQLKANDPIRELFSEWFMRKDFSGDSDGYKITTAIADLHLGKIIDLRCDFAGVIYPSVSMAANGDNLAIQCNVIDNSVVFRKAIYLKIDEKSGNKFQITNKNNSIVTNSDGKLIWLGRILHWQVPPQQQYKFEVVTGSDGFGDYEIGKSGEQLHWKVTDQIGKEVTAN